MCRVITCLASKQQAVISVGRFGKGSFLKVSVVYSSVRVGVSEVIVVNM